VGWSFPRKKNNSRIQINNDKKFFPPLFISISDLEKVLKIAKKSFVFFFLVEKMTL